MANVAVLGGGITGLSCAYYLRKLGHDVVKSVSLYERQTSAGGLIKSTCFPDGTVYDHGPNSLRTNDIQGHNSLALAEELGLTSQILPVTRSSPSANKRLILVNTELHELPNKFLHLFYKKPPFRKAFYWYLIKELKTEKSPKDDDTVDNFVRRRLGDEIADFVSDPMCRGISAGSSKDISIRSLMPSVFKSEQEYGSVLKGMPKINKQTDPHMSKYLHHELPLIAKRDKWATWTFKKGLQQLPVALEEHLLSDNGVKIFYNNRCDRIQFEEKKCSVHFEGDQMPVHFDHIFACIPARKLSRVVRGHHPALANHLSTITAVNVATINLEYRGKNHSREGFGYLVPSNQKSKILGVIFNSCSYPQHDGKYSDKTRFTCMMGGKWFREYFGDVDSVSPDDLLEIAVSEVGQHLKIQERPARYHVTIAKNCIPQYRLGHYKIIESVKEEILSGSMPLSVAGASYNGVGVNDCIYDARLAVENYLDTLR